MYAPGVKFGAFVFLGKLRQTATAPSRFSPLRSGRHTLFGGRQQPQPAHALRWCHPHVLAARQAGLFFCHVKQQSQPAGLSQQVSAPGKTIHVSCRVSGGSTHIAARQALLWGTPERPVFRRSALMMLWRWFSACTDCVAFIRSILA